MPLRRGAVVLAWFAGVMSAVWAALAHLLLLTLLVVAVHHWHWLDDTEGYFRRQAVEKLAANGAEQARVSRSQAEDRIHVLEFTATMRTDFLERGKKKDPVPIAGTPAERAFKGIGGVLPINRCKLADSLQGIASRLTPASAVKVLAIDIDVTPPPGDDEECPNKIKQVLIELSTKVTVVAVAMDRDNAADRFDRNQWMSQTCGAAKRVYFASPRIFHSAYNYPLDFSTRVKHVSKTEASSRTNLFQAEEALFPSLGNLIGAAAWLKADDPALTLLCRQAADAVRLASGNQLLLEDLIPKPGGSGCDKSHADVACPRFSSEGYKKTAFNWRLLDTDKLLTYPVSGIDALTQPKSADYLGADAFDAKVLVVSVDGGEELDKFHVPALLDDPVSGAMMHGLQALSERGPGYTLDLHSPWGIVFDLGLGFVFLVLWKILSQVIGRVPGSSMRFMLTLVTPVAIGWLLFKMSVDHFIPFALGRDIWISPAYILLGLIAHAYVEAWHRDGHHHGPDFSFGLARCLRACLRKSSWTERLDASASLAAQWAIVTLAGVAMYPDHHDDWRLALVVRLWAALGIVAGAFHLISHRKGAVHAA